MDVLLRDLARGGETEAIFQLLLLFVASNHGHGDTGIFNSMAAVSSHKICGGPEGGHRPCFARTDPEGGVAPELTAVAVVASRPLPFTAMGKLGHPV